MRPNNVWNVSVVRNGRVRHRTIHRDSANQYDKDCRGKNEESGTTRYPPDPRLAVYIWMVAPELADRRREYHVKTHGKPVNSLFIVPNFEGFTCSHQLRRSIYNGVDKITLEHSIDEELITQGDRRLN